jgi:hypothetical protein
MGDRYPIQAKGLVTLAAKHRRAPTVDIVCQVIPKETPHGMTHRISKVYYSAIVVKGEAIAMEADYHSHRI